MDAVTKLRGRSNGKSGHDTLEIRNCRYCKAKFEVDPRFPHKEFCSDSHRKLHWRYGAQSIGKVAQRIERDMRKLIAAELAPLRARVDALERARVDALERGVIGEIVPYISPGISAKRGGGAGA